MKLFCRDEMQRLEMAAVAAGVPLSQLMDNAGAAVAQEVERRCRPVGGKRAVVLCVLAGLPVSVLASLLADAADLSLVRRLFGVLLLYIGVKELRAKPPKDTKP